MKIILLKDVKKIGKKYEVKNDAELQKALAEMKDITIEMTGKVNDKGHLFAGIHKEEIIEAVKKQKGVNITADHLLLDKPIKEVGEHVITVKVGDREVAFKLVVKSH